MSRNHISFLNDAGRDSDAHASAGPVLVAFSAEAHSERMFACYGLRMRAIIDVSDAACGLRRAEFGTPGPRPSLSELTQKFLGATTTPPSAQYADRVWERTPLSHTERWFAAEGAWVAVEIHGTLSFTHGPQVCDSLARSAAPTSFQPPPPSPSLP